MHKLTTRTVAIMLLITALPAAAQLTIPTVPSRATAISPVANAVLLGQRPAATHMTFVWDQPGGIYRPLIDPPPPRAFIICVRGASASTPCAWPGVWSSPAANIPSKAIRNSSGAITGYRYTFRPTAALPDTWLDKPVVWTIAACANVNGTACSTSTPQPLHVSSIDLVPQNVSIGDSTATDLVVTGAAINLGTGSPLTNMRSDLFSFPALLNSAGECATDVNHADYVNTPGLAAVLGNGTLVTIGSLPRLMDGTYDKSNVRAIIRTGDPVLVGDFTFTSPSNLTPGGRPVETQRLSTSVLSANRPLGVVSILILDGSGTIIEYDEANNVKVECKVLM